MAVPAHQRPLRDETDEELSDAQIQELLDEAERSLRAKQQGRNTDSLFRLPKLQPGNIADVSLKTEGSVTRVDPSKLVSNQHRALAAAVKRIEDPIQAKKQKLAVRSPILFPPADDDNHPISFFLSRTGSRFGYLPASLRALYHSYTEACHRVLEGIHVMGLKPLVSGGWCSHLCLHDHLLQPTNFLKEKEATAGSDWFNLPKTDVRISTNIELNRTNIFFSLHPSSAAISSS
jgi:hypothetical protein